jgi:hypothetical protein
MKKTIFILTLLLPVCFLFAQDDNVSDIYQQGNGNFVKVTQVGDENTSDVYTFGNNNEKSFVYQEGKGENFSKIDQNGGNGNSADVNQLNDYTRNKDLNESEVFQYGNGNHANVDQIVSKHNNLYPNGGKLDSKITQDGNRNTGVVDQNGIGINAKIEQSGNASKAKIFQGTSDYYAGLAYRSDANINQGAKVTNNSKAKIHQVGLQNDARIKQNSGNGSVAEQIQINAKGKITDVNSFDVNNADIEQKKGGANTAYQLQFFNNKGEEQNRASAYQEGSRNYSQEVQIGGDNWSDVQQIGNNNTSKVYQSANGVADPTTLVALPFNY